MADHELSLTDVDGESDVLFQVRDGILEVFQAGFAGSLRVPVAWAGVQVEPKRHEHFMLSIGERNAAATGPSGPLYGGSVRVLGGPRYVHLDATGEQTARAFFAQVAADAGRAVDA